MQKLANTNCSQQGGAQAQSLARRVGLRDAVTRSSPGSNATFVVCRNWAELTCQTAEDRRVLAPGQDTRTAFEWEDADGRLIAEGCTMRISGDHRAQVFTGPRWFKVVGLLGLTQELTDTCPR